MNFSELFKTYGWRSKFYRKKTFSYTQKQNPIINRLEFVDMEKYKSTQSIQLTATSLYHHLIITNSTFEK